MPIRRRPQGQKLPLPPVVEEPPPPPPKPRKLDPKKHSKHRPKDRAAWLEKRQMVIRRAGGMCERCKVVKGVHVHHKSYPEVIGHEKLTQLLLVCLPCHKVFHPERTFNSPLFAAQSALRKRAGWREPAKKPRADYVSCAYCGGTYTRAKHKAICLKHGVNKPNPA